MIQHSKFNIQHSILGRRLAWAVLLLIFMGACKPKEEIVLRNVRDIVIDANTEPLLRAQAILYNPNNIRIKLRSAEIDVYVNGKKAGRIDQELKMMIPAAAEFTVPLEVKLNMKELGLMDTIMGMLGGKKLKVEYKGSIRLTYKGVPIRVPINHESEVRIKF